MVERSGVREEDVQFWLSTLLVAFGLALTFAAPITAWGGDKLGSRQTPMVLGSLLAPVGTAIFCVAEAPWLLVVARICQGASNGAVYSAGLPLIADTVSQDEVGSWCVRSFCFTMLCERLNSYACRMGFVFSGMTGGFLVSPFLAGIVYTKAGYFPVFIMVFASLMFDLFLRAIIIEGKAASNHTVSREQDHQPSEARPEETTSSVRRNASLSSLPSTEPRRASMNSGSEISDESSTAIGSDSHEHHSAKFDRGPRSQVRPHAWFSHTFPKMSILLNSPRLLAAVYGCFTYMTIVGSFDATLPLFVKRTFGWDSQGVGLIFLAMTAPALAGAAFGALSDRYGPKNVALSGFGISSLSLALLALIRDDSLASKVGLAILLVLMGQSLHVSRS